MPPRTAVSRSNTSAPPPISKMEQKISDICIEEISLWPLLTTPPPPCIWGGLQGPRPPSSKICTSPGGVRGEEVCGGKNCAPKLQAEKRQGGGCCSPSESKRLDLRDNGQCGKTNTGNWNRSMDHFPPETCHKRNPSPLPPPALLPEVVCLLRKGKGNHRWCGMWKRVPKSDKTLSHAICTRQ